VVIAVIRADLQRAIEAFPTFIAGALEVVANSVSRAIVGARASRTIDAIVTSIAAASAVNTASMVIAVVGARSQPARCALEPGKAVASAIVAITLLIAVLCASQQRAIESRESISALARLVQSADSISAAIVRADSGLAFNTRESRLAEADSIFALPMVIAIVGASLDTAILGTPPSHAPACSIEANTMASAISGACSERAVRERVVGVALTLSSNTCSVSRTVVVASLGLNTRNYKRRHHENENFESHLPSC